MFGKIVDKKSEVKINVGDTFHWREGRNHSVTGNKGGTTSSIKPLALQRSDYRVKTVVVRPSLLQQNKWGDVGGRNLGTTCVLRDFTTVLLEETLECKSTRRDGEGREVRHVDD